MQKPKNRALFLTKQPSILADKDAYPKIQLIIHKTKATALPDITLTIKPKPKLKLKPKPKLKLELKNNTKQPDPQTRQSKKNIQIQT
jgi:hypothetical protein